MGFFSWLFNRKKIKSPKIGLALGSGGAKGFAELGALKAFEENDIKFDVIAGTSIGSIIGAFYADGYTSTDIGELIKTIDPDQIKNLFMINMDTFGLFNVIDRTIGNKNIEELNKPFKAVATEVESGDAFIFETGSVAKALCASSSYPPFFKPVIIDNKRYVDGAFANSVPADIVRQMGADYVVGIDLSSHEKKQGFLNRIIPTYKGKTDTPWELGYKYSDVMLHPDLSLYSAVGFRSADKMFDIGYDCAIKNMPKIKQDLQSLSNKKHVKKG